MKKLITLFIVFAMLISVVTVMPITANAAQVDQAQTSDGYFTYDVNDDTATITGFEGYAETLVIPEKIDGYTVTEIDMFAFSFNNDIVKVVMPDTAVSVGPYAFCNCKALEEVVLSNSLTNINDNMFMGCEKLRVVNIPDSVIEIEGNAFYGCKNLTQISLPEGLKIIQASVFSETGLTEVTLPSSVEIVWTSVFDGCTSLEKLTILGSKTRLDDNMVPVETTIYGYTGSTAEEYASKFGNKFVPLDDGRTIGDVDGDGNVSIIDATAIQLHIAAIETLDSNGLLAADADKDGNVSIMDATQIQLFIAQLIPEL